MSVVKMNRIQVLGLLSERTSMLEALMKLGVVQIIQDQESIPGKIEKPSVQADLGKMDTLISELTRSIDILKCYCPQKKLLFSVRRTLSEDDYSHIISQRDDIISVSSCINRFEDEIIRLKGEENRQLGLLSALEPWLLLDIPLNIEKTRHAFCYTGTFPARLDLLELEKELEKSCPETMLIKAKSDREHHYVVVIGHMDEEASILNLLKEYGWNRVILRDMEGTPQKSKEQIEKRLSALNEQKGKKILCIKDLNKERERIETVCDGCRMERARIEARSRIITTRSVFQLKGWIPAELSQKVKSFLEGHFCCTAEIQEPDRDEPTPVLIENGPIVEAINPVLNMYGLPSSGEIDPSPVMLPFFIFFFGLMLGDAGYGIIMALASGFALKKFKMEDTTRKFVKLVFFCGLATILAGVLTGSWFGISALSKTALWIVPTENPELMMSWAILFGIIHMYVGLFLKGLNLVRRGHVWDAVFDILFRYILFTGFILTLLPYAPGISISDQSALVKTGNILFLVGIVLLLLTQGRKSKNMFGKIFGGLGKLYDVVSFFSDCLSYTRLVALGLASSIIGDIVNTMSTSFGGSIIVTVIAGGLIIIVGHIINFGLNVLGAFVHSCRLQFLEFFGKFLEGGGEPFRPLKADTKYIIVRTEITKLLVSGRKSRAA